MEFAYHLDSAAEGWAEAGLADEQASVTIPAAWSSDALGELLEALANLLDGAQEARCRWDVEPDEYRWIFQLAESHVRLRVLWFPEMDELAPERDERGKLVFATRQSLSTIAAAIVAEAERILVEYGEDGYLRRWVMNPFPTSLLERVRAMLARD